jgi:hypothetical protein
VERLDIQCGECRTIADRIVRGGALLYLEKQHIEQHVTRTREALRLRKRATRGVVAAVRAQWHALTRKTPSS